MQGANVIAEAGCRENLDKARYFSQAGSPGPTAGWSEREDDSKGQAACFQGLGVVASQRPALCIVLAGGPSDITALFSLPLRHYLPLLSTSIPPPTIGFLFIALKKPIQLLSLQACGGCEMMWEGLGNN